jgi:hypothetical protein
MYANYIKIGQSGVGRITETTPEYINGLFTTGIETCVVLVFISENEKNISFIHFDAASSKESVLKEIEWIGNNFSTIIAYNEDFINRNNGQSNALENLINYNIADTIKNKSTQSIEHINCNDTFSINRQTLQNITIDTKEQEEEEKKENIPPYAELRHHINSINRSILPTGMNDLDLQFNGSKINGYR